MSDSLPPVVGKQSAEPAPSTGRFARFAALFSLLTPFIIIFFFVLFITGSTRRSALAALGNFSFALIVAGLILGIAALTQTKRHGRKGIFGKAVTGICLNGFFLASLVALPFLVPLMISKDHPRTPQARLDKALNQLNAATNQTSRFYKLGDAAKECFNMGKIDDARKYATELLELAPIYQNDWNYGNAIQDGNLVLGRIALTDGRIEEAKQFLLASANSRGSPQMNSFGPNMSLAKDLLEKGEKDVVLQYFELCRKFWDMHRGDLDEWSKEVKAGKIPHFGANLVY
jgi:hypothetical protein